MRSLRDDVTGGGTPRRWTRVASVGLVTLTATVLASCSSTNTTAGAGTTAKLKTGAPFKLGVSLTLNVTGQVFLSRFDDLVRFSWLSIRCGSIGFACAAGTMVVCPKICRVKSSSLW